jgi:hypothetical protein
MMNDFYDMTYQLGIDESKIDRLTLYLSLCSFRGARTYDAGLKLCCVCDMFEKSDVNNRGELWIIEAFHLANLPTIPLLSRTKQNRRFRVSNWSTGFMQPFSFLLLITSLAFALPAKSAEHKVLASDNFGKTIAKGYW